MPFNFPTSQPLQQFRRNFLSTALKSPSPTANVGKAKKRPEKCRDYHLPTNFLANSLSLSRTISSMNGSSPDSLEGDGPSLCLSCAAKIPLNTESLRKRYSNKEEPILLEKQMLSCPFAQFDVWFKGVVAQTDLKHEEVNAFALSTVNREGRPSSRMLLLKGYGENGGFVFFTHSNSRKGRELATNNFASALFYWPRADRQVRIEGRVKMLDEEIAENYWYKRPIASRIGSKLSDQSSTIPGRQHLAQKQRELERLFAVEGEKAITRPNDWIGYTLRPEYFEFWQGQSNRVHDRIVYEPKLEGTGWAIKRLSP